MRQDAVLRNFQVMGDAIKDLSPGFRAAHPEVGWREPSRFRDRITHDYLEVDLDVVWDTIKTHLPLFKNQVEIVLQNLGWQKG